jgi:hypothetical protein
MQTAIEPTTTKKRRPRKTEFKVNELPEDAKQEVLDRHRYRDVEDFEWWDDAYANFEEDAKAKGFEIGTRTVRTTKDKTYQKPEIYFSGFCSQGDGASFAGTVDLDKYIRAHLEDLIKAKIDVFTLRKILNNDASVSDWEAETPIITQGGHYCHENTMDISFNWRGETPPEIEKAFTQMQDFILEDARDLAKELYKKLEEEHDYLTSDEAVIESLNANDQKFTRDGEDI